MEYETRVKEVLDETHDVKTFRLERPEGLSFKSGQYATVALPGEASMEGESRPFTFSSSPTEKRHIDLTIKKMGEFTGIMFTFKGGERISFKGPSGEALVIDETVKEDLVFVAGGSGITPFMSAIRYAQAKGMENDIVLFYANRTEEDIIFKEELEHMQRAGLKIVHALSDSVPDGWTGEQGRIGKDILLRHVERPKDKMWLLCGPPPMISSLREILKGLGVPEERIKEEPWQLPGKHDR